ncbi:MAG TPA: DUF3883 domain-containing protein [Xanthomonadaceae bacterium]|nr:DUF3883 domain-containing protein [Xanthomonadaceae bacterium]
MPTPDAWSDLEVEACVADYLRMLTLELSGQSYNKSEHRRALASILNSRSDASIELKHQNISAALFELGCPHIIGYKRLPHYQQLLFDVVARQVAANALFNRAALVAAEQPAAPPLILGLDGILVEPPTLARIANAERSDYARKFAAVRRDYFAREALNRSLGDAGEIFVAEYEIRRLHAMGKRSLGERVERVSQTQGDGLGYDVLSFEESGKERYIEVKTTSFSKETPFYVSRNEIAFSEYESTQFHLYRLFEFRKEPKLFDLPGVIAKHCILDPVNYLARFS